MPEQYKHVIRPDGTIRIATTSSIKVEDGELLVTELVLRQPGQWFYDFKKKKLVGYTKTALKQRKAKKVAAKKVSDNAHKGKLIELRTLVGIQSPELRRIFELMADLSGIEM
tara:strand:+ start:492 stop:827 length:336 start_codon:yes stop_codon:yes gene_type:complete